MAKLNAAPKTSNVKKTAPPGARTKAPASARAWPSNAEFVARFRVEDLVPAKVALRAVFVGESPHRDEVSSPDPAARSPFRGVAGREWWGEIVRLMAEPAASNPVPPRGELLRICRELRFGMMNAVQYPIDLKIMLHQGEAADPRRFLGFAKGSGEDGYKAVFKTGDASAVAQAIADLRGRLERAVGEATRVVCLGNDSRWFVEQAISSARPASKLAGREIQVIPHPSSWWRNRAYRERAVGVVHELLG